MNKSEKAKLDHFLKNKVKYHGAHVFENVYYEGCELCKQRKLILSIAEMQCLNIINAVSDAELARKAADALNKGGL